MIEEKSSDPRFLKWKRQYDAYKTHSRCGLCLYFRSPKCTFANAPIKPQDASCSSFFPLAERIEIESRRLRASLQFRRVKKEVEEYG